MTCHSNIGLFLKLKRFWVASAMSMVLLLNEGVCQHLLGLSSSNYAGTNSLYLNPAFVVDNRLAVSLNLVTTDFFVTNNYLAYGAPYTFGKFVTNRVPEKYRSSRGRIIFSEDYIVEKLNGRDKRASVGTDLRGPSVLVTIDDRNAVALTSRMRVGINVLNASENVARLMRYGPMSQGLVPDDAQNLSLSLNTNAFAEFGASYGRVLLNDGDWFVKGGITVKRLVGLFSDFLIAENASYRLVRDPDPTQRRRVVLIENIDAKFGYTLASAYENFRPTPGWIFGNNPAGAGWGADLGLVYEYRPNYKKYAFRQKGRQRLDPSHNKYKYRVSASLMDIGAVRYNNSAYVYRYDVVRQNLIVDENRFVKLKDVDGLHRAVDSTLAVGVPDRQSAFNSALPMALHLNFDVRVKPNVYVSGTWIQNLKPAQRIGMPAQSVLAIAPRYETKWVDVSMPISIIDMYSRLSVGLAARLGPLSVGTDNLGGILNIGNPRGINAYVALQAAIYRRKPQSENICQPDEKKGLLKKLQFWKKSTPKRTF